MKAFCNSLAFFAMHNQIGGALFPGPQEKYFLQKRE
jgi:hypothetical protein